MAGLFAAIVSTAAHGQAVSSQPLPPPSAPNVVRAMPPADADRWNNARQPTARRQLPAHDGWGNDLSTPPSGSITRMPLDNAATRSITPGVAVQPGASQAQRESINNHLDSVQDLLTDQENVRPDMVGRGENLDWAQMDDAIDDGDFADPNSAEKQIGWIAKSKTSNRPKLRRPKVDLKAMTRLKLNENGSTVFDITKGQIVTKF